MIRAYRFIAGVEWKLPHVIILSSRRFGWGLRPFIAGDRYLYEVLHGVKGLQPGSSQRTNYRYRPWPHYLVAFLNRSLEVEQDAEFLDGVERVLEEQEEAFGLKRLQASLTKARAITKSLREACDPYFNPPGSGSLSRVQQQASFAASQIELLKREHCVLQGVGCTTADEVVVQCMCRKYDDCKTGRGSPSHCEYLTPV